MTRTTLLHLPSLRRLAAGFALLFAGLAAARDETPVVVVTRIEGPLAESMMSTLDRAVRRAEEEQARFLVVEIDTPGGEVTLMDRLATRLDRSKVTPVTYVLREAVSAGAYLAMAGERIFTSEHAQIGSSTPVMISPFGGALPEGVIDDNLVEKQISYVRSKFRDRAQSHERPGMAALAEAMVDPRIEVVLVAVEREQVPMTRSDFDDLARQRGGAVKVLRTICKSGELLNLTAREALDLGFSDEIVAHRDQLLESLAVPGARVVEVTPSWSEKLVEALEHLQWLLLVAGLVLLYVELKIPGFGVPGALGIACLGMVLFRNYLVGLAEIQEILLVALGLILVGLEIFVIPGFGIAGVAGIACVALGVMLSFLPFLIPEGPIESSLLRSTLRNLVLTLIGSVIGIVLLSRYVLPRTPLFRRLVLDSGASSASLEGSAGGLAPPTAGAAAVAAGDLGIASTDLRPAGKVEIGGGLYDARSDGDFVTRGRRVLVLAVASNHLVVRPAPETSGEGTTT